MTACKATGLLALQEKSKDISDLVIDMESVAVSKAETNVEDVPIKTVVLGEAYIARNGKTGTPDRFVCLLGERGKALLTFSPLSKEIAGRSADQPAATSRTVLAPQSAKPSKIATSVTLGNVAA
ncbi:hypothetical protein [Mesorhizobium intechi]|uniref:hypothetical protein n=1 Tax=Mesorhizobium intechi TaxID=537601 RepID=UPI001FE2EB0E|nr:hypothetical protein [Mesorhizobium intechi]